MRRSTYTTRDLCLGLSANKEVKASPVRVDFDVDGSVALRAPLLSERESLQPVGQAWGGLANDKFGSEDPAMATA